MQTIDLLNSLTKYAKEYNKDAIASVKRNGHMNELGEGGITQSQVDAVVVDFINFIGMKSGVDYALYTSDLS